MEYSYFKYPSPLGILEIKFINRGIIGISFPPNEQNININNRGQNYVRNSDLITYKYIFKEMNEYFTGRLKEFEVPVILRGTEFQKKVWQEVMKIPYGESKTYGDIANIIDSPNAARAVGNANHQNNLPIIIPCHRVIGANGKLTGYAGGLERKKWLLNHEKKHRRDVSNGKRIAYTE